jgi:hypothetical protein
MVVPKGIRVTKQGKTDRNSRIARLMSPAPLDRFRRGPSVRIARGLPKTYCSLVRWQCQRRALHACRRSRDRASWHLVRGPLTMSRIAQPGARPGRTPAGFRPAVRSG